MPRDLLEIMRERIAEAIGGRDKALALQKSSQGRFNRSTVQSWIDGKTAPDLAELHDLAAQTGRPLSWFLPLDSQEPPHVLVPMSRAEAAAGAGANQDEVEKGEVFPFSRAFIERLGGSPAKVESLRASGDSMEPTILGGALLMLDTSRKEPPKFVPKPVKAPRNRPPLDRVYVFVQDGHLRLKRLRRLDAKGLVAIISDNIAVHPPEFAAFVELTVLGEVIWWDNRL
jgi:phage repressor protein C with HTH and peptisase S24 domain